jgi:RecA-family ATPase
MTEAPEDFPFIADVTREFEARAKARNGSHEAPPTFARILNPAHWEGVLVPQRKWIVPNYIPDEAVTLLSGDGGLGKSILGLQLGAARSLARDWIGLLPEPGRTLVLSAEDDADEMHRRLDAIRQSYGASWADLSDLRLVDLVGEDPLLAVLAKGRIEPSPSYEALNNLMAKFKPGLVILDVLADLFPGDERDRAQVRQFINLLKSLCRKHNCAVLLLSHPSLTGMNTGTLLSGSTDWNNGVRSRLYLQTPKASDGTELNKNLRTFQGMKANYGECGGKIDLEWKNGVFVPVNQPSGFSKLEAGQKADEVFLAILKRFNKQNRNASDRPGTSFAPTLFAEQPEAAGITKTQLKAAMERLWRADKISIVTNGPKSRPSRTFVVAE